MFEIQGSLVLLKQLLVSLSHLAAGYPAAVVPLVLSPAGLFLVFLPPALFLVHLVFQYPAAVPEHLAAEAVVLFPNPPADYPLDSFLRVLGLPHLLLHQVSPLHLALSLVHQASVPPLMHLVFPALEFLPVYFPADLSGFFCSSAVFI